VNQPINGSLGKRGKSPAGTARGGLCPAKLGAKERKGEETQFEVVGGSVGPPQSRLDPRGKKRKRRGMPCRGEGPGAARHKNTCGWCGKGKKKKAKQENPPRKGRRKVLLPGGECRFHPPTTVSKRGEKKRRGEPAAGGQEVLRRNKKNVPLRERGKPRRAPGKRKLRNLNNTRRPTSS